MMNPQAVNNEHIIQFSNGKIFVPDQPIIPFIEGDGCGPEVWLAARQVVEASVMLAYLGKRAITWKEVYAGKKSFDMTGSWLPPETIEAFRTYHVGIKGPLTTPVGEGIRSLNVALRKELDLFTSLRPVKFFPGTPSPLRKPDQVDIVLFRENTEDVYAGIEFEAGSAEAESVIEFLKEKFPEAICQNAFPGNLSYRVKAYLH